MHTRRLVISLLLVWATTGWAVESGDIAPAWTGSDIDGQSISFPAVTGGKPAVVVFWATWCPYCKAFMPSLKSIQKDYASDGVQIITINALERGFGDPKPYLKSLDFPLVGIIEGDEIAAAYDVEFIPGLMVVGSDGIVTYRRQPTELPAGRTLSQQWDAEIRDALNLALR